MDKEILRHASEAYRSLLAAEARYYFVPEVDRLPRREQQLLDQATIALANLIASPHSER
jgi:hypothetical protein